MDRKLCIDEINVANKRILMRVDFNIPMKNGIITNMQRITTAIPTIKLALSGKAKSIVLISHLGRPQGRRDQKYTLKPVAIALSKLLNITVQFLPDSIGEYIEDAIMKSPDGSVFLLENLRFYLEEEGKGLNESGKKVKASAGDVASFSKCLTKLGEVYVNDAFGTAHRAHASMIGVNLPVRVAGLLMKKELKYFNEALKYPKRPFLAILGGAKVSDKIVLIFNLLDKINELIITGGMAFTFLKTLNNMEIGVSLYDLDGALMVQRIMKKANSCNVTVHLPVDFITSNQFAKDARISYATIESGISNGWMGLDIGSKSIAKFNKVIAKSKTIIWNGPMGVFEFDKFAKGSMYCMEEVVKATRNGSLTIIGGGDTASCFTKFNSEHLVSHVSTGGGASLELLEGKVLPGIKVLNNYDPRLDEGWKMAEIVDELEKIPESGVAVKAKLGDDEEREDYVCPYREHKCACSEVLEKVLCENCVYPLQCQCPAMQHPLDTNANGCGATEKLCKTMRCPLCCFNITCKKNVEKCHPCIPKSDLAYRYNLFPERSVVCTTNIKPSDHSHNEDFFKCIDCETFFNRNIPFVNNDWC